MALAVAREAATTAATWQLSAGPLRAKMAVAAVPLTAEHAEVACEVARGVVDDALARVLHAPCPARARQARRRAWVTLLTNEAYAKGVEALARSLVAAESRYQLVAMLGGGVPAHVRASLAAEGVECRDVRPLPLPSGEGSAPCYACEHFAACWAKLRMWEWEEEFEQLVYLDADMIVVRGIDELLDDDLGDCPLRAVQVAPRPPPLRRRRCPPPRRDHTCGGDAGMLLPRQGARAPLPVPPLGEFGPSSAESAEWRREVLQRGTARAAPAPRDRRALRRGAQTLRPRRVPVRRTGRCKPRKLTESFRVSIYSRRTQDFLNGYFGRSWRPLPWPFNASKALFACHRSDVWDYSSVRSTFQIW